MLRMLNYLNLLVMLGDCDGIESRKGLVGQTPVGVSSMKNRNFLD